MSRAVELRTLGSPSLRRWQDGEVNEPVRVQPKHLGVLAYLAAEPEFQFRRRDTLLATFWPELDTERARNALNQALYRLRESVGRGAIPSRGNQEVGVSRAALTCDAIEFEEAVEDGRLDDALALYRGPFLDGFHLSGVPQFERWTDSRREQLRQAAHRCARDLGERRAAEGAVLEAVRSLERAIEIAPTREGPIRRLMELLRESGDRAAGLRAYRRFERRLQEDFDLEPSDRTRSLARSLEETASPPPGSLPRSGGARSLVLLPFRALGEDSADAYFLEGMEDALLTELGRVDGLHVTATRPRAPDSPGTPSGREMARRLGVDAVLEGGILREGDRVRISARLVQAEPESHLWTESFVRDLEDVLALHQELATAIAREVAGALTEEARPSSATPRIEPAAYDLYLRGRFFTKNVTEMPKGIETLRQAIEADPTFAPAYAEIALCHCNLAALCYLPPSETAEKVDRWVERALELDPRQAEAHTARGFARTLFHREWKAAEADFRRAVELNPTSVDCHAYFTFHLTSMGAWPEGLQHVRRALELDPLEPGVNWAHGWTLHKARRWAPSTRALERTRELYPNYALLYPFLAANHAFTGDAGAAHEALNRGLALAPDDQLALGYGTAVRMMLGDETGACELAERLENLEGEGYRDPYYPAVAAGGLGDADRAFELLREMCEGPSVSGYNTRVDPLLDPVRDDPRFDEILDRLDLPAPENGGSSEQDTDSKRTTRPT